jgi:putative FmdB family regulatory protein
VPTYQYACTDCGDRSEVVQRFTDDPLTVCSACGGKLRKVFSPVGIVFKGSGFYRTDSRNGSSTVPAGKDKDKDSSASSSNGSGSSSSESSSGSSDKSSSGSGGDKSGSGSSGSGSSGSTSSGSTSSSSGSKSATPVS